jgi:hypothetical protein
MRNRFRRMMLRVLVCLVGIVGCGAKNEGKLPPEMPKGGLKNVPTKGMSAPKPLSPPP